MIKATKKDNLISLTGDTFYFKDTIKEIKGYKWDAANKVWLVPLNAQALDILGFIGATFCPLLLQEVSKLYNYNGTISVQLPIKATPYNHQVAAFNFALNIYDKSKGFALLADMGTGKTITTIALMGRLYLDKKISRVLIAAPKSILSVWRAELSKFADFDYEILDKLNHTNPKKPKTDLLSLIKEKPNPLQITILNYESIWRQSEEFDQFKPDFVVADESSKIKNTNAKQSKAMHKLGKASKFNIILSGTPITNSQLDIYSQYKFLNDKIFDENWWLFQKKYATLDHNNRILGFKNLGNLLSRMHRVAYRVKLQSVIDMPPIVNLQRIVQLSPSQKKQYYQLQKGLLTLLQQSSQSDDFSQIDLLHNENLNDENLDQTQLVPNQNLNQLQLVQTQSSPQSVDNRISQNTDHSSQLTTVLKPTPTDNLPQARYKVSHDNILVKLLKLAQFTGGFATDDDGATHATNNAKIDELDNLLDEFADKKIVIFARFRAELQAISQLLMSKNVEFSLVFGDTKNRQNQVDRFQNLDNVRVFLGQIATAGMGITLTAAHTTIYFSLDFSYQNYEQSRSRTFRIGQKHPCTYIHLLVQDSIDNLMYNALLNKKDVAKQLVDDYKNTI